MLTGSCVDVILRTYPAFAKLGRDILYDSVDAALYPRVFSLLMRLYQKQVRASARIRVRAPGVCSRSRLNHAGSR